jgi:hypothetical protein
MIRKQAGLLMRIRRKDVTDPLSLNWYIYCDADPINNIEPTVNQPNLTKKKSTPVYKMFLCATKSNKFSGAFNVGGFKKDKKGVYHANKMRYNNMVVTMIFVTKYLI